MRRLAELQLDDLRVPRPRVGAHQDPDEEHHEQQEREEQGAPEPELHPRARRGHDAAHHGLHLLQALLGGHAVDELLQEHAVVPEEAGQALGQRRRLHAVGGAHHVEDQARRPLGVGGRRALHGRVADQDHVQRDVHLPDEADGLVGDVALDVRAGRRLVHPVRGVGVRDGVGDQDEAELGALRVRGHELASLVERGVVVRPLAVVPVARHVVDEDLLPAAEEDQPVGTPLEEREHLLEGGHALLLGVEWGQGGGVVDEEEDDRLLRRRRGRGHGRGRSDGARACGREEEGEGWSHRGHGDA